MLNKTPNKTSKTTKKSGEPKAEPDNVLPEPQRDITLSEEEAKASSPSDESVCGEEDPGAGLEFLVKPDNLKSSSSTANASDKKS